jgi:hypothetical protein
MEQRTFIEIEVVMMPVGTLMALRHCISIRSICRGKLVTAIRTQEVNSAELQNKKQQSNLKVGISCKF